MRAIGTPVDTDLPISPSVSFSKAFVTALTTSTSQSSSSRGDSLAASLSKRSLAVTHEKLKASEEAVCRTSASSESRDLMSREVANERWESGRDDEKCVRASTG